MKRVSDEWLEKEIAAHRDWEREKNGFSTVRLALEELQARRKADKEHWHINPSEDEKAPSEGRTESERAILPTPCTIGFENCTVKQWFQKINEELDELKDAILYGSCPEENIIGICNRQEIAEEAADTITAITSMCEAMGIDEQRRQEAQKRVNEKNQRRGRIEE